MQTRSSTVPGQVEAPRPLRAPEAGLQGPLRQALRVRQAVAGPQVGSWQDDPEYASAGPQLRSQRLVQQPEVGRSLQPLEPLLRSVRLREIRSRPPC